jgi:hypothetical protein
VARVEVSSSWTATHQAGHRVIGTRISVGVAR